jgi:hypothetical protein
VRAATHVYVISELHNGCVQHANALTIVNSWLLYSDKLMIRMLIKEFAPNRHSTVRQGMGCAWNMWTGWYL